MVAMTLKTNTRRPRPFSPGPYRSPPCRSYLFAAIASPRKYTYPVITVSAAMKAIVRNPEVTLSLPLREASPVEH